YSVPGIVFAHLMGGSISSKVMLLTPAFRNMDMALEEAAEVSGASKLRTMLQVTLPVMLPPMLLVFMLNIVRIFQSFEIEQILGTPIGFFVFSTKIFQFVREFDPPEYGQATALASLTLVLIAGIIPLQRWLLSRRQYTTVTGRIRPGLIDLGKWQPVVFWLIIGLVGLLTVVPILTLVGGSFMTRVGFFQAVPTYTLNHWKEVLVEPVFIRALWTTAIISLSTGLFSPFLFSILAYILVRTRWRGRTVLDSIFWMSAAIPGMLSGLGLLWMFLGTPGLSAIYGTIWALILVVVLQGKLTGTQLFKAIYLQMGSELEESARTFGAGWWYTYFTIWLPLIMPTMILIGILNFVLAAQTTSSIILLASRETITLSILALEAMGGTNANYEQAGIVSLFIVSLTVVVAIVARSFGLKVGLHHQ
ncbi:MAG: ABC transporter permease subunit, partial [Deltaproteobacteria bacterium]|nr:ABC transporter permease subunit [Deltaproteobacteria bacterium]